MTGAEVVVVLLLLAALARVVLAPRAGPGPARGRSEAADDAWDDDAW